MFQPSRKSINIPVVHPRKSITSGGSMKNPLPVMQSRSPRGFAPLQLPAPTQGAKQPPIGGMDPRPQYVMPKHQRSAILPLQYASPRGAPRSAPTAASMKPSMASNLLLQKMEMVMDAPCPASSPASKSARAQHIHSGRLRMLRTASPQKARPLRQQQWQQQRQQQQQQQPAAAASDKVARRAADEVAADEEAPARVEQKALVRKQEAARKHELETKEKPEAEEATHKAAEKEANWKAEQESLPLMPLLQKTLRLEAHHKAKGEAFRKTAGKVAAFRLEEDARENAKHEATRKNELEAEQKAREEAVQTAAEQEAKAARKAVEQHALLKMEQRARAKVEAEAARQAAEAEAAKLEGQAAALPEKQQAADATKEAAERFAEERQADAKKTTEQEQRHEDETRAAEAAALDAKMRVHAVAVVAASKRAEEERARRQAAEVEREATRLAEEKQADAKKATEQKQRREEQARVAKEMAVTAAPEVAAIDTIIEAFVVKQDQTEEKSAVEATIVHHQASADAVNTKDSNNGQYATVVGAVEADTCRDVTCVVQSCPLIPGSSGKCNAYLEGDMLCLQREGGNAQDSFLLDNATIVNANHFAEQSNAFAKKRNEKKTKDEKSKDRDTYPEPSPELTAVQSERKDAACSSFVPEGVYALGASVSSTMSWMMAELGLRKRVFCVDDSQISIHGDMLYIDGNMWLVAGANMLVQGCLVQIRTTSIGIEIFDVRFSTHEKAAAFGTKLLAAAGREKKVCELAHAARSAACTPTTTHDGLDKWIQTAATAMKKEEVGAADVMHGA